MQIYSVDRWYNNNALNVYCIVKHNKHNKILKNNWRYQAKKNATGIFSNSFYSYALLCLYAYLLSF